jgi:hypothetical protein
MPRDGGIIFSDLIGKLDVLRVTCATTEKPPPLPRAALFYFLPLDGLERKLRRSTARHAAWGRPQIRRGRGGRTRVKIP